MQDFTRIFRRIHKASQLLLDDDDKAPCSHADEACSTLEDGARILRDTWDQLGTSGHPKDTQPVRATLKESAQSIDHVADAIDTCSKARKGKTRSIRQLIAPLLGYKLPDSPDA